LRSSRSHAACRATCTSGRSPRSGMNNMDPRMLVTRKEHAQSRLHRPATRCGNNEAGFPCPRGERAADRFVVRQRRRLPEPARRKEMPADPGTCRGDPQINQGRAGPGEGERDSSADPRHGEEGRAGIRGRVALKAVRKAWLRRVSRQPVRSRTDPAWPEIFKAAFPVRVKERFAAGERDRETRADFGIKTWFMNRAASGGRELRREARAAAAHPARPATRLCAPVWCHLPGAPRGQAERHGVDGRVPVEACGGREARPHKLCSTGPAGAVRKTSSCLVALRPRSCRRTVRGPARLASRPAPDGEPLRPPGA